MSSQLRRIDWNFVRGVVGLLFSLTILITYLYRFASLVSVQNFVHAYFGDVLFQAFFMVLVTAIAGVLFYLRQTMRGLYAAIEIAFGILAGVYAANQFYGADVPDSRVKAVFAAVAGIYIIVRGLENWRTRETAH
jgi:hypothetical protein